MVKRVLDILLSGGGLLVLGVPLLVLAAVVLITSGRPAFFRQQRVGQGGRDFTLFKFRTMTVEPGAEQGSFDAGNSRRVTPIGRLLRKTKLDELPQLWNVFRGDMSMVGPRPEVRKWVQTYPDRWARVLAAKPGITDPASIQYRDEESILAASTDPEELYRLEILPKKLDLYENYLRQQNVLRDFKIILETVKKLFAPRQNQI